MNIQQHKTELDRLNRATVSAERRDLAPPSFGEEHRGAIDSIVTGLVGNLSKRIEELRNILSQIEQQVLTSAERAMSRLEDHVAICVRVDDEIRAMRVVIDDLAKDAGREP